MQKLKLEKSWEQTKQTLMESNIDLTEADLQYTEGDEEGLLNRLSSKIGKSPDEVRTWIESASANKAKAG